MSGAIRRRDSKGRILFDGEQQKSTGQYEYRYYDGYGVSEAIREQTICSTLALRH